MDIEKLIKTAADRADKEFDFKRIIGGVAGVAIEWFDGSLFRGALTWGYSKTPEQYKDEFAAVLAAYVSDDYSSLKTEGVEELNKVINLPGLDEVEEGIILNAFVSGFLGIVEKRRAA